MKNDLRNEHYRRGADGERNVPKVSYNSPQEANKYLAEHYKNNIREWSVYKCLICGKWHIGHSNRVSAEEKLKEAQENIKYLKELLQQRDELIFKLKGELCYYSNLNK